MLVGDARPRAHHGAGAIVLRFTDHSIVRIMLGLGEGEAMAETGRIVLASVLSASEPADFHGGGRSRCAR